MEQQKINEGNKLIADFLNWDKHESNPDVYWIPNLYPYYHKEDERQTGATTDRLENMRFHIEWNWLMPVWKKLSHLVYEYRHALSKEDYISAHIFTKQVIDSFQRTDLESAYENIVEFIKWHNQYNPN